MKSIKNADSDYRKNKIVAKRLDRFIYERRKRIGARIGIS
jgi:hypothetical protein